MKLNAEQKLELMRQAAEIAKSASSSEKIAWNIEGLVSLLEKSYIKMLTLVESEETPKESPTK